MTHVDSRRSAPAADRNKEPILAVLRRVLPDAGLVLEIASGTGQHVAHFAAALPHLEWQPSDGDPEMLGSIDGWVRGAGLSNVRRAIPLDVHATEWPVTRADAIVCVNMIHIAPWSATEALMRAAGLLLPPGGVLALYGPFRRSGDHTSASNAAFDASLRERDPAWGVRDLETVEREASRASLHLDEVVEMPANNLAVVFRRRDADLR